MDIRKILHLPPKQEVFEGDPAQRPQTPEFEIVKTADMSANGDARVTEISSMALERAGVASSELNRLPTEPRTHSTGSRSKGEKTYSRHGPHADIMKHMLGGLGDSRVRTIMEDRRKRFKDKPARRRTA